MSSNANVLKGIYAIVNPDAIKPDMDVRSLEKILSDGGFIKPSTSQDRFTDELAYQAEKLNLTGLSFKRTDEDLLAKYGAMKDAGLLDVPKSTPTDQSTHSGSSSQTYGSQSYGSSQSYGTPKSTSTDSYSDSHSAQSYQSSGYGSQSYDTTTSTYDDPFESPAWDMTSDIDLRTREEQQRRQISAVSESMGVTACTLDEECREDQKIYMLEQIVALRGDLELAGVPLTNIKHVDENSSYTDINNTLRSLLAKNDRSRYCTIAEEVLIWGACSAEDVFDGKKSYFGYRPDLTGWHHSVNMKLRRMRYDTSQVVSNVMQNYDVGPVMRILLEIIPNAILYSRSRKDQYAQPGLSSDADMSAAFNRIRDQG